LRQRWHPRGRPRWSSFERKVPRYTESRFLTACELVARECENELALERARARRLGREISRRWSGRLGWTPGSHLDGAIDHDSRPRGGRKSDFRGRSQGRTHGCIPGCDLIAGAPRTEYRVGMRSVLTKTRVLNLLALGAAASSGRHPAGAQVGIRVGQRPREGNQPGAERHRQENGQRSGKAQNGIDEPTTSRLSWGRDHPRRDLDPKGATGKSPLKSWAGASVRHSHERVRPVRGVRASFQFVQGARRGWEPPDLPCARVRFLRSNATR
jgi:hypothetical protein